MADNDNSDDDDNGALWRWIWFNENCSYIVDVDTFKVGKWREKKYSSAHGSWFMAHGLSDYLLFFFASQLI